MPNNGDLTHFHAVIKLGRPQGSGNEAKFFKTISSVLVQCPWCSSWHTVHQGSMWSKKRCRCEDCKRTFYISKEAKEVN